MIYYLTPGPEGLGLKPRAKINLSYLKVDLAQVFVTAIEC
jgi:hypothetical protein